MVKRSNGRCFIAFAAVDDDCAVKLEDRMYLIKFIKAGEKSLSEGEYKRLEALLQATLCEHT